MERQIYLMIVSILTEVDDSKFNPKQDFTVLEIAKVWFWAVLHDRPISWAVQQCHWPAHERKWNKPSNSTMSRRLRSETVKTVLQHAERRVIGPKYDSDCSNLVWFIDGKPMPIGGCSKDRQAGYGRAAGGKAKGYKIHAIIGADQTIAAWRVAPMNKDERVMGERLVKHSQLHGYLVADSNYDSNKLHSTCDVTGNLQLVCRRRNGPGRGLGHRKQTGGRLRSKEILENPDAKFGDALIKQRDAIERSYGNLSNWGGGLTHLPAWARTHRRVHRWVQAKLIINQLKPRRGQMTYAK